MFRFALPTLALLAAGIILAVLWLPGAGRSSPAEAHGAIDQSQTQGTSQTFNNNKPMQQSFKPTASSLVAVDLKLSSAFADYPDLVWTVAIRSSFEFGPIIGLATMKGLTYNPAVYHVDFASPIAVTPGDTYWIEASGQNNYLQWNTQFTGNPYANGAADAEVTSFYPDADRYFVTYSSPPITPTPVITPRPTRTPRP